MTKRLPVFVVGADPLEAHSMLAEHEAERWRLIADVTTSVAACRSYEELSAKLGDVLRAELETDGVAYFEDWGGRFELVGSSRSGKERWFEVQRAIEAAASVRGRVLDIHTEDDCDIIAVPMRSEGALRGYLCVARASGLDERTRALLTEVVGHLGNVLLNVHHHADSRSRLKLIVATIRDPELVHMGGEELAAVQRAVAALVDSGQAEDYLRDTSSCEPQQLATRKLPIVRRAN